MVNYAYPYPKCKSTSLPYIGETDFHLKPTMSRYCHMLEPGWNISASGRTGLATPAIKFETFLCHVACAPYNNKTSRPYRPYRRRLSQPGQKHN